MAGYRLEYGPCTSITCQLLDRIPWSAFSIWFFLFPGYFPTEPNNPGPDAKGNITQWPYLYERRESVSCENTEHLQRSEIPEVPEQRGEGESTLRKSLDTFYRTLCQKKPSGGSPRYESTSQCLSLKTADLAGKEGMKFIVKNLQIAQMVLNREENKIFPQPPCNHFCLLTPVSADANSEKGKAIPGLSDDVFRFILKQNWCWNDAEPERISQI